MPSTYTYGFALKSSQSQGSIDFVLYSSLWLQVRERTQQNIMWSGRNMIVYKKTLRFHDYMAVVPTYISS